VQRALTDLGADEAFAHAAQLVARIPSPSRALPAQGVSVLLAEADRCMVPTVTILDGWGKWGQSMALPLCLLSGQRQ